MVGIVATLKVKDGQQAAFEEVANRLVADAGHRDKPRADRTLSARPRGPHHGDSAHG